MAKEQFTYDHPRPSVTVDAVCLRWVEGRRQVGLVRRGKAPFQGCWALPGGFVEIDEDLPAAVLRELKEETGLVPGFIEQFRAFGEPGRDPRGRTISLAYLALVKASAAAAAADDAEAFEWFDLEKLPELAFDHNLIIDQAQRALADWRALGRVGLGGMD